MGSRLLSLEERLFIVAMHVASKYLFNAPPPKAAQAPDGTPAVDPRTLPPVQAALAWPLGQPLDMHVFLSTSPIGDVFSSKWTSGYRKDPDEGLPNFVWKNLTFGDYNEARVVEYIDNDGRSWVR